MKKLSLVPMAMTLAMGLGSSPAAAQQQQEPINRGAGSIDMMTYPRPIEAPDVVWIEDMTMPEVRDAIKAGKTTALILTGGIEENGPYLTTGKHNNVLRVEGEAIARKLGNALIAPIVTLEPGNPERAKSPGTVFLSQETYQAVLSDMATSLKAQGFTDVILIGDSGGNQRPMQAVAEALEPQWKGSGAHVYFIPEYYNYDDVVRFERSQLGVEEDPRGEGFHDDYYITTIIMNHDPEAVRLPERIKAGKASINGVSLLPKEKAIWDGKQIIDFRAEATVNAIKKAMAEAQTSN